MEFGVRTYLKQMSLMVLLTLAGCAPTVNSQSGPVGQQSARQPAPTAPAPAPVQPAADAKVRVALLLPMSGPQAELGQNLFNAAQLALYDLAAPDFALLPEDTASTPEGAQAALQQAFNDGAQLIIGPVFSAEVQAITQEARSRAVPVLALSNNNTLARDGVYVLGQTPDDQVDRVLSYAKSRGLNRIAAIISTTAYGTAVEAALRQSVQDNGLSLVHLERAAPSNDPGVIAAGVAATLNTSGGADAILLPDSGNRLIALATALRNAGITSRLLGTATWDANQASANPALAGGWYAAVGAEQRVIFSNRYQQTFGAAPAPIATLVYDATAVAAVLAKSPEHYSRAALLSPTGFSGVDGLFRLNSDGTTSRGLAVYELTNAGVRVLDAAPAKFAEAMN